MSLASPGAVRAHSRSEAKIRPPVFICIHMNGYADRPHLQALSRVRSSLEQPMRAALPALGDEMIAAIRGSGARVRPAARGRVRRGGARRRRRGAHALRRRHRAPGRRPAALAGGVLRTSAAGELRQGRTLEALLAAYRVGARVSWRRVAEAATAAGAAPTSSRRSPRRSSPTSTSSPRSRRRATRPSRPKSVCERQRQREELVRMLLAGGAGPEAIAKAAAAAGWEVPRAAAAVVARDARPGSAGDPPRARTSSPRGSTRAWPARSCPTPTRPGGGGSSTPGSAMRPPRSARRSRRRGSTAASPARGSRLSCSRPAALGATGARRRAHDRR